jgi:hypothetical protein
MTTHTYGLQLRRQAAYAKKQARLAKNDTERESWLWIAQGWISLSRKRPQSDEEVFNQQRQDKGTGQDDSESSH